MKYGKNYVSDDIIYLPVVLHFDLIYFLNTRDQNQNTQVQLLPECQEGPPLHTPRAHGHTPLLCSRKSDIPYLNQSKLKDKI